MTPRSPHGVETLAGGAVPPTPPASAPHSRCIAAVPWMRNGVPGSVRCDESALPMERLCALHFIASGGREPEHLQTAIAAVP